MTVLTHDVIKQEIQKGNIVIRPELEESQYGPASIDLTLSNEFRVFIPQDKPVELFTSYEDITVPKVIPEDGYIDLHCTIFCTIVYV